ncbi:MAG: type I DNA topoisomerase [Candidatus Omnitrophota bacterium]|nr:MAG: type I DNA topoisomerase [Candidatus Omnitrophota bacterium]
MGRYLVVVESPTKAKTISKILGKDFEVTSSMGHVVDLPPHSLGVSIKKGFLPYYRTIPGKEKIIKLLREKAKGKEAIYLATDPDREGEAIGWHIKNKLARYGKTFFRVVFYEITEDAIKEAFTSPQDIDMKKVNAQKARRILDRIVGYFLSPLLWKKIVRGLSAGRVQSVALKFIVEREREIESFTPQFSYGVEGNFTIEGKSFKSKLIRFGTKKAPFSKKEEAKEVIEEIKGKNFFVRSIRERDYRKMPPPPFITSSLQQEAFNKFRFSSQKTMILAQKLYEGVEIGDKMVGVITYMRTDSYAVSEKAKREVRDYIKKVYGSDYLFLKERKYKERKQTQGAHEAIRPTDVSLTPEELKKCVSLDLGKLYELIWQRFLSSFMKEAILRTTKVEIISQDGKAEFLLEGKKIIFDGYQKVTGKDEEAILPPLREEEQLILSDCRVVEHKSKPPARFTDASLVKLLEEKGIGRPSTYAPTISTLIKRNYIRRERGYFVPRELGIKVCDLLMEHFPEIMDESFTAKMEEKLDAVEEGELEGIRILEEFYPSFRDRVVKATQAIKKHQEVTKERCPKCGSFLVVKWSRRGKFLSCSQFPQCKYAKSIDTGVSCPECKEGVLIERRNKKGYFFYGCSRFPKCRYTTKRLPQS